MASTYSTNLAIELIGTGDQAGSWGNTTNTNLGTLIEQAISGYVTQAVSTGTDTTITIPNGATGVARNMYIELTGTGGTNTNLIVPANKKLYFIFNNTSSGQVTVKVSGQTGVSVPNKAKMILVSNGTDIVDATNYIGNISAASANITVLTSASATITNLIATSASITTLTNNPTFGAGTANGVLYLNGSKVATSGSALVFDGTNFSSTGTATVNSGNSSSVGLVVKGETGNGIRQRFIGQAASGQYNWQIGASITAAGEFAFMPSTAADGTTFTSSVYNITPTGVSYWSVGGSEQMRLTSTGLGIGTASPTDRLNVGAFSGNNVITIGAATTGTSSVYFGDGTGADRYRGYIDYEHTNDRFVFGTSGTGKAYLDSSGNLGLGVTPSAWSGIGPAMQFGSGGAFVSGQFTDRVFYAGVNSYYNGTNWVYINTDEASHYRQFNGVHSWHTAPSGTAGNPITGANDFVQTMTLDASGNLGIGTSSPNIGGVNKAITVNSATSTNCSYELSVNNVLQGSLFTGISTSSVALYTVANGPLLFGTNNTERARITSGGALLVGTTSEDTSARITIRPDSGDYSISMMEPGGDTAAYGYLKAGHFNNGAFIGTVAGSNAASDILRLGTGNTERARITSGGKFCVNAADTQFTSIGIFASTSSGQGNALEAQTETTGNFSLVCVNKATSGDNAFIYFGTEAAGTQRGSITYNRGAGQVAYNVTSDARLKDNIADATDAGNKVDALQVRQFDWKETGNHVEYGFVAQELNVVAPHAVTKPEDEEAMWSVDYSKLVPMLVKEIQSLRARVAQLESK
jgi:hypothetical protein